MAADEASLRVTVGIPGARLRIAGLVLLLGSLVTVELALNPAEAVSPGTDQLTFDVVQFILVEFQLCLEQVDLLLQGASPAIVFCTCELLLELVDSVLIGFYRRFGFGWPEHRVSCSRAWAGPDARWPGASRN